MGDDGVGRGDPDVMFADADEDVGRNAGTGGGSVMKGVENGAMQSSTVRPSVFRRRQVIM